MQEKKRSPLVSAVIITHNRKLLAQEAVNSVLRQTYQNIECIIVDDKSDDGSETYLKNVFGNRIRYHYISASDSKGGNHARNIGISLSQGKYIAFLDDDDVWLKDKVESQVSLFESYSELGMVYCLRYFCYQNKYCWKEGRDSDTIGDVSKTVFKKIITSTSTMMFSADAIKKAGGFDESLSCWQETELMMRFAQEYKIGCVDRQLVFYTIDVSDPQRISNKFQNWEKSMCYIEEKYAMLIKGFSEDEKKDWTYMKYKDAIARSGSKKQIRELYSKLYEIKPSRGLLIKKILNYKASSPHVLTLRKVMAFFGMKGHFIRNNTNNY